MAKQTEYLPDELALVRMRDFLNDGASGRERMDDADVAFLRVLMDDWRDAKGNWRTLIANRLKARRPVDFVNGTFNLPSNTSRPVLVPYPAKRATHEHAVGVFLQFVLHPENWRLAGPCPRKGCGRYSIRKTAHPKSYCSTRCSSNDSTLAIMRRKREAQRAEQVAQVEAAMQKYRRQRRREDWRIFVQTETGITPRTLDGWVKRGFIKIPMERKGRA